MGGECFKFVTWARCPSDADFLAYQAIVPRLVDVVREWLSKQETIDWTVVASEEVGIVIDSGISGMSRHPIIKIDPLRYDNFRLGWQDYCYGRYVDPKKEIADLLMGVIMDEPSLKCLFRCNEMDTRLMDLGMDESDCGDDERQVRGILDHGQFEFSDDGLYGGYNDWEDYLDANDLC